MREGDELCGQEEAFRTWAKKVFKVTTCAAFRLGGEVMSPATHEDRVPKPSERNES